MLQKEQENVKNNIIESIIVDKKKKIILKGSAGVGKTYMVQYLIKEYRENKPFGNIYIIAPTNKAVEVLREKAKDFYDNKLPQYLIFSTIHAAFFLKRKINEKTGEITFIPDYNPTKQRPFDKGSLIIIDESSMIDSNLLLYLEEESLAGIPMIFLGDNAQINPVNELHSPIFKRIELYNKLSETQSIPFIEKYDEELKKLTKHYIPKYIEFELTEIQRQVADNPIIHLSRNLNNIFLRESNINSNGLGYKYTRHLNEVIDNIIIDPDNNRYLAWTNAEVNRMNVLIRHKIFNVPAKIENGETIILGEPYEGIDGVKYTTNAELKVKELVIKDGNFSISNTFTNKKTDTTDKINIKVNLVYYLINNSIRIIHEDSQQEFYKTLKTIKDYIKIGMSWKVYFDFTEEFAKFHYMYALTIHKSQGSTYKNTFINMKDINRNQNLPEKTRLWYTAITRASDNITFYDEPKKYV